MALAISDKTDTRNRILDMQNSVGFCLDRFALCLRLSRQVRYPVAPRVRPIGFPISDPKISMNRSGWLGH